MTHTCVRMFSRARAQVPCAARPALASTTALASMLVLAQALPLAAQAVDGAPIDLGTLVLTGTKRDETLGEFSGSVKVKRAEDLEERAVLDGADVIRETPGANYYTYGDRTNSFPTIRGVGPLLQPLSPDDSSVLTFVDGAPLMLEQSASSYLDLEQVEVFKGPQNTLFGRSTSGGAINLVPVLPSDVLEGRIRLEYGNDDHYVAEVVGNVPIVPETLSARLALRKNADGAYIDNTTGPDFGEDEIFAGRASLLWTPSTDTSVLFTFFAEEAETTPAYYIGQIGDDDPLDAAQNFAFDDTSSRVFTLKLDHDFGATTFTSQTSYNTIAIDNGYQGDHNFFSALAGAFGMPMPPAAFADDDTNRIAYDKEQSRLTQEFRLASNGDAPLSWVTGIVAYRDIYDIKGDANVAFFGGGGSGLTTFDQTTEGAAIYGDASYDLTDQWTLSGGLRFTRETKEYDATFDSDGLHVFYPGMVTDFEEDGKETYEYWTGKIAVNYAWSDDLSTYASVSRGYKSGGFGVYNNNMPFGAERGTYESSETISYELGARASLLGGNLELSGALFFIEMSDEQIMLFNPVVFSNENANLDAISRGFELDAVWYVGDNWLLDAGLAYTDTEITGVPDEIANDPGFQDIEEGNQLPNTPKWAGNLGASYRAPAETFGWTGDYAPSDVSARIGYSYNGDRFFDAGNEGKMDAFGLWSGRLGLTWGMSELYIYGENLTDEEYFVTRQPFATQPTGIFGTTTGRGRTFGIGFSHVF